MMSQQRGTGGGPGDDDSDAEPKILGVEDIPGAVSPEAAGPGAAAGGGGGGQAGMNERLAAFRQRRAGQAGGGAGEGGGPGAGRRQGMGRGQGQGMGMGRGGGGAAQGEARANADEDPIAAGKRVLEQFNSRLANAGEDKRGMQYAIRTLAGGYEALEKEVERLRGELERAHEAIRTVQRQGD